ncbi:hypothetical protein B0H17DRAFT_890454, partial [Mycena rosella]
RMDIFDNPASRGVVATFEVPGVKVSDISVSVSQGTLLLQNPQANGLSSAHLFPCQELRYGTFRRAIPLPSGTTVSPIAQCAILAEGLLTVAWPRSSEN